MATGLLSPHTVDLLSVSKDGVVDLGIIETNKWTGSPEEVTLLKNKIDYYSLFFTGGQFSKLYPDLVGKPVRIRLFVRYSVAPRTLQHVERFREDLLKAGIGWDIKQLEIEDTNASMTTKTASQADGSLWKRFSNWFLCRKS